MRRNPVAFDRQHQSVLLDRHAAANVLVAAQPAVQQRLDLVDGNARFGNLQFDAVAPGIGDVALALARARIVLEGAQVVAQLGGNHLPGIALRRDLRWHVEHFEDHRARRPRVPQQRDDDADENETADRERQIEGDEEAVANMLCAQMLALQARQPNLLLDKCGRTVAHVLAMHAG